MSTTTRTRTGRHAVDWSLAPRGPVSATVQGALALGAAAVAGDLAGVHPVIGGAATAAAAVGAVVRSAHLAHPPAALLYRLICTLGGGGWLTYALASGDLWTQGTWGALGVGALAAGVLSPLGRVRPRAARPGGGGRSLVLSRTARVGQEWEERIRRVCRAGVTVTDVHPWPNGCGYDVHLVLPPTGVTRRQIAAHSEALATAADLPEGCGVDVQAVPGAGRSRVMLRVSTVNRLAQAIDYPADYSPRSILEPIVWGEYANSDPCGACVREEAMLIAGKRGSGKTTLLQVVSIALARCRDTVVWHLDLNGGGLTQPWIDVWLAGRVQRCPIDWAAKTLPEGKRMLRAAIQIAQHRKASYRKLKRQHNTNLLPVSPQLPKIVIVVDEGAEAVRDRELAELLGQLQRIGRNEAVDMAISALRPTSDLVPVNMRKQSGVRIQMHGPDDEELAHMFGWSAAGKLSMDQLAGKGTGFVSINGAPPRPFRGYNVLPAQVEEAALAIAAARPDLDEASARAAGPDYATRYERMREAFTEDDDLEVEEGLLPAVPDAAAPAVPSRPRLVSVPCGPDASGWPDLLPRRAEPATSRLASADAWPDLTSTARRAEPAAPQRAALDAPARPLPPILAAVLAVFDELDDDRVHSEVLADRLGMTPGELADALRPYGVGTLPNAFERNGARRRGYALADVQAAADRAAD